MPDNFHKTAELIETKCKILYPKLSDYNLAKLLSDESTLEAENSTELDNSDKHLRLCDKLRDHKHREKHAQNCHRLIGFVCS